MKRILAAVLSLLLTVSLTACAAKDPFLEEEWVPPVTNAPTLDATEPTEENASTEPTEVPKEWSGLKWVCVGDSITEANDRAELHYYDYVSEETGITVINMGISGTGFKSREGAEDFGDAYYQRIEKVPTDADVITIFASGNDLYIDAELGTATDTGTDTICGCINTTLDKLFELMPDACVGIVTPTPWKEFNPADEENLMEQYTAAVIEICRLRGIPYLDLYHTSGLRPWDEDGRAEAYSRDGDAGCHPDENGHAMIAPKFKEFLESII